MAAAAPAPNNAPTQPAASPAPTRSGRSPRRRRVKWIIAAIVLAAILVGGVLWWHHSSLYASTEDAYINGNQVEVTALVGGTVQAVHVVDQQRVKAGDPLFEIDPANSEIAPSSGMPSTSDVAQSSRRKGPQASSSGRP